VFPEGFVVVEPFVVMVVVSVVVLEAVGMIEDVGAGVVLEVVSVVVVVVVAVSVVAASDVVIDVDFCGSGISVGPTSVTHGQSSGQPVPSLSAVGHGHGRAFACSHVIGVEATPDMQVAISHLSPSRLNFR